MSDAKRSAFSFRKRDPLVLLGIAILLSGILLGIYGLIPQQQPKYSLVTTGTVPIFDPEGNNIFNPEQYFTAHYNGTAVLDNVQCFPSQAGWICDGFTLTGTAIAYSIASRYYGLLLIVLGLGSVYAGNKLSPFKPKPSHTRPITVRVDEDICVANSVCVALAPNVFQLKKQEAPTIFAPLAYVVDPTGADNDTIIQAAEMCPTGAIIIEDAETGERIHPPLPKS